MKKKKQMNPAEQARYEIDVSLNPGKQSDTAKALELRKALKGKMTPLADVITEVKKNCPPSG